MAHWLLLYLGCALDKDMDSGLTDTSTSDTNGDEDSDSYDTDETDSPDTNDTSDTEEEEEVEEIDCPENVVCINQFPYNGNGNTSTSSFDLFDSYACAPSTNESGKELYYRLTLTNDGFIGIDLPENEMGSGVDVDVHLLGSRDSDDCIDRGHWSAGSLVTAGEYWLVVDSWVSSSGEENDGNFGIEIGFTSFDDFIDSGMETAFAEDALFAFDSAWKAGETSSLTYAVTDFSMHSSLERMWLWDLSQGQLETNLHISHGEASSSLSDSGYADEFSNIPDSHQSSLGMMRGAESYYGSFDYSMRLDGLEDGYNDLVRPRAIVMHGWTGSRQEYVNSYGEVAPTWGCPSVDDREVEWVVDTLKDGSLLFFWYPDNDWSIYSEFLQ